MNTFTMKIVNPFRDFDKSKLYIPVAHKISKSLMNLEELGRICLADLKSE